MYGFLVVASNCFGVPSLTFLSYTTTCNIPHESRALLQPTARALTKQHTHPDPHRTIIASLTLRCKIASWSKTRAEIAPNGQLLNKSTNLNRANHHQAPSFNNNNKNKKKRQPSREKRGGKKYTNDTTIINIHDPSQTQPVFSPTNPVYRLKQQIKPKKLAHILHRKISII